MDWLYFLIPILVIVIVFFLFKNKSSKPEITPPQKLQPKEILKTDIPAPIKEISFKDRLKIGLGRSRTEVWGKLTNLFSGPAVDEDTLDSLEELLYSADIGTSTVGELIQEVKKKAKEGSFTEETFKKFLFYFS